MSGAYSRNKGIRAERDVVTFLRNNGFAGAERAVRTGYQTVNRLVADPGDVIGLGPGVVVSVKDAKVDYIDAWLAELDGMAGDPFAIRILVSKRAYKADPGRWWCWLRLQHVSNLIGGVHDPAAQQMPVRMEVSDVVKLLRQAGYGDEQEEAS